MMRTIHNDKHLVLQSQMFWFVDGKNECTIIMRTNSVAALKISLLPFDIPQSPPHENLSAASPLLSINF
jgi:hypothetical protein